MKPLNYIENQLFRVFPAPILDESTLELKLKFYSTFGQSNWLDITPAQMRAIEAILRPYFTTQNEAKK